MTTRKPKEITVQVPLSFPENTFIHTSLLIHEAQLDKLLLEYENGQRRQFPVDLNNMIYQNMDQIEEALDRISMLIQKINNIGNILHNKKEAKRLEERRKELNQ